MTATTLSNGALDYEALLSVANRGLIVFTLVFVATVVVCYPLEHMFSLGFLVGGHITMIVSSAFIKISYVSRCVALKGLNREVA